VTACDDDDIKDDFTGPGYDAQKGGLQPPLQASYVAATTVLLMSSDPAKQMLFTQLAGPVIGQVATQPGLVGYQIAISAKCHYARTLTVWKDMDSMMEFVASPNHAKAMENGSQVASAAAVTEWTIQASDMPPTWALARTQIAGMGQPAY
jgi:heme-degrading monooxygenase HmoA